jgi:hypothetical protein
VRNEESSTTNGSAILSPAGPVVAGSPCNFTLTYTAGPDGIGVGGSVRFETPHGFTLPQIHYPHSAGYCSAICSRPAVRLSLTLDPPVELDPEPFYYVTRWGRMVYVQVLGEPLQGGDALTFSYGTERLWRLPPVMVQHFAGWVEFTVATDVTGTRSGHFSGYTLLADQPRLTVTGGEVTDLAVCAPSYVTAGEPFPLRLVPQDRYRNLSTDRMGNILFFSNGVYLEISDPQTTPSGVSYQMRLDLPGQRQIETLSPDHGVRGFSNPIVSLPQPPEMQIYWGDIHGHSRLSDGLGTVEEYYQFGRDVACLDFCALADHAQYLSDEDWVEIQAITRRFNEPHRFVTLLGYEYSCNANVPHYGDKCLYYPGDEGLLLRETDINRSGYHDTAEFADQWKAQGAMMILHQHAQGSCSYYDPDLVRLAEVYSVWGVSESDTGTRPLLPARTANYQGHYVADALEKGWVLGLLASSDDHGGHPGCTDWLRVEWGWPGGLVAVMAPELTREAIWEALWNRRCYGTTGARIIVEFRVDGEPMGSVLEGNAFSGSHRLEARIFGTSALRTVEVLRGREVIHIESSDSPSLQLDLQDGPPPGAANYYYLRVTQADGEMAWCSPVWVM